MRKITSDLESIVKQIKPHKEMSEITSLWKEFFTIFLSYLEFNQESIERLFVWGKGGNNWDRLGKKPDEIITLEDFISEIDYIYDRMSLDRLFRAHWLYNNITL